MWYKYTSVHHFGQDYTNSSPSDKEYYDFTTYPPWMNAAKVANPADDDNTEDDEELCEGRLCVVVVGVDDRCCSSKKVSSVFETGYDWMSWTQHH